MHACGWLASCVDPGDRFEEVSDLERRIASEWKEIERHREGEEHETESRVGACVATLARMSLVSLAVGGGARPTRSDRSPRGCHVPRQSRQLWRARSVHRDSTAYSCIAQFRQLSSPGSFYQSVAHSLHDFFAPCVIPASLCFACELRCLSRCLSARLV